VKVFTFGVGLSKQILLHTYPTLNEVQDTVAEVTSNHDKDQR